MKQNVYTCNAQNGVGITVEDDGDNVVVRSSVPGNAMLLNDDMARAVADGLLRRAKLAEKESGNTASAHEMLEGR